MLIKIIGVWGRDYPRIPRGEQKEFIESQKRMIKGQLGLKEKDIVRIYLKE